jgi:hypothetical protein
MLQLLECFVKLAQESRFGQDEVYQVKGKLPNSNLTAMDVA